MRQILRCAWLLSAPLVIAACSGEAFSPETQARKANDVPASLPDAGAATRSHQGGSSGGNTAESDSGKNMSAAGGAGTAHAGSAGSGGTSKSGGASAGGATIEAPQLDGGDDCEAGAVKFRMIPAESLPRDFLCDAGCGTGWLTLLDADGGVAFSLFAACGTASCETCEVQACGAAACLPTALGVEGAELTWNGTYLEKDTCGNHMACQRHACVKPGKYKARACAALNKGMGDYGCAPSEQQLCAEAEFEFPGTETVQLVLHQ
jgi:hypothetical protein